MCFNYSAITSILAKGNKYQFDIPVDIQYKFLYSLKEPRNDIDRAFAQYKCQMLFVSYLKRVILNILSLIIFFPFIVLMFINRITVRFITKYDAICEESPHSGAIPDSLKKTHKISSNGWSKGLSFGFKDIFWILKLFVYIFKSPYFSFKILYKSAMYSTMIKKFRPNSIIVYNEYSFTSSALTYFCEKRGIDHINVMHGEKLFYIRDSFFRFTKAYVWDEYYIELLSKLRAPKEQFIAEIPPFIHIDTNKHLNPKLYADYKYYLAIYDEQTLKNIIKSLSFVIEKGFTLKYRPHPRYSNINLLKKYIPENQIEYPHEVGIEDSISNLKYGIGLYTTVLNQCFHAYKGVIIDDMNFPQSYHLLYDMDYILLKKPIKLLSSYQ